MHKLQRRANINRQMVAAFVTVALLPVLLFASIGTFSALRLIRQITEERQFESTITAAKQINNFIGGIKTTLSDMGLIWYDLRDQPTTVGKLIQTSLGNDPLYSSIWIMDTTGQTIVQLNGNTIAADADLKRHDEEEFFFRAVRLSPNEAYFSSVRFIDAHPQLIMSIPIYSDRTVIGVVAAQINLEKPWQIITDLKVGRTGYALLTDERGALIAHQNPDVLARSLNLANLPPLRNIKDSQQVYQYDSPVSGVSVLGSALPIDGPHWTLIVEFPTAEAFSFNGPALIFTIVLAFGASVAAGFLGVFISRRITRPIIHLAETAQQIEQGNLSLRVQVKSTDEIGDLARAFNNMTTQLQQTLEGLENRVEERTVELKMAQSKTEEASKAKSGFLSNMSHELRTPLNVILGYTSSMLTMPQMYKNQPVPEIFRQDIELIMENGQYLLGLINDILDLSKIEAGKLELTCADIELEGIFKGVLATSIGLVKDKPIQIRSHYPSDLPPVHADDVRVRQIILNLMSNAIKFTNAGSVTLQAQREDSFVRVSVIDTGIGIPEKALAYIFDRFQQVQHGQGVPRVGNVLGLDISKQLTAMHGGQMTVTSTLGEGSTFSFTLPVAHVEHAQPTGKVNNFEELVRVYEPEAAETLATRLSVLVIEDETSLRRLIHQTLENAGHIVVDTDDGAQALDFAASILPDVIILDLHLPTISGFDILQDLKASPDTRHIPVIICTGYDEEKQRGLELGAALFVEKPVQPEKLMELLPQLKGQTSQ